MQLIDSCAWPTVALIALMIFREPLLERMRSLRSVTAGRFAAEFGDVEPQVDEAIGAEAERAAAESSAGPEEPRTDKSASVEFRILDGFQEIAIVADDNPSYAVVASWSLLERILSNYLETVWEPSGARRPFPRSGVTVLNELQRMHLLEPQTIEALGSLRRLRNEVAHGSINPEVGAATAYVQNTSALAEKILMRIPFYMGAKRQESTRA